MSSPARGGEKPPATPVTLVLGSGGARGLAHIGVIQALLADGQFKPAAVTGSSIGALVGGLYAAGKLDDYTTWVRELKGGDVWSLLDFAFSRSGLFTGERLMKRLQDILGDAQIEDLPIPFTAVACDLHRRQEVWLDRGSLFQAIRASIAIPGLFTPVQRDGRLLVDGGLLCPLPVVPALQHHQTRLTIAVSLNGVSAATSARRWPALPATGQEADPARNNAVQQFLLRAGRSIGLKLGPEQAPGPDAQPPLDEDDGLGIISKSIDTMQDRIARHQLAACQPDLLVEVPVDACSMLEFHRADELIALGQRLARRTLRDWRRRQDGTVDDDGPQVTQADNQASDQSTNGVDGETRPPHPTAVGQKGPAQAG